MRGSENRKKSVERIYVKKKVPINSIKKKMIFQFTLLSLIFTDTNDNEDIKIQKKIGARN